MAQFVDDINRKLIPRWRSSELTIMLGEMAGPNGRPSAPGGIDDFDEKLRAWRANRKMSSAAELLAAGFVHSRLEESREGAEFILKSEDATDLLRDLARRAVDAFELGDPDDDESAGSQIRRQRNVLSLEPRNPFKWVDLARNHLLVGRPRKAKRAMDVALQLAPDDRFVVRSAIRLYLHLRQPDRAHHILSSAASLLFDPALVSAEIAVSALMKNTSHLMRRGFQLLDSESYPEAQLGELSAVIATEELLHGSGRKVRKLFKRSLTRPNENTVAQVRWAASKTDGIPFDPKYLRVDRSFEARAWAQFFQGEWGQALVQSRAWLSDQGFSKRPAALGSYIAAVVMEDHLEAIGILRRGLTANPGDPLLLNNMAYSLACMGDITAAESALQKMNITEDISPEESLFITKLATSGLIEYRKGNAEAGRSLYRRAVELSRSAGLDTVRARVIMFFALEEARSGTALESPGLQMAIQAGTSSTDRVLPVLANRLIELGRSRKAVDNPTK